ncbi:TadE-like protein [Novosphingobium aromaticivorans DSM 12444]|uniref:TadE-like protein n=2 Tax=Novosphingobium aromaticivorans TaxID=48935 RepID=Q2G722_NOVAD|nr:TadE-like protein [Novosphingobium aromaticivorans DSM 12444]SCY53775.1 Putative Flp pilus-assembly TadE/G-like [Novosphingobium aromaticivorans]
MTRFIPFLSRLRACRDGAIMIEVAVLTPVLVLFGLGTVEVSSLVARRSELQSALAEAVAIALASKPDTQSKIDTIESVISASTGVSTANIDTAVIYRCGIDPGYVTLPGLCSQSGEISKYVQLTIRDTYTPMWTDFGISGPISMRLTRTVLIG